MKKEIVIASIAGLVLELSAGTQINRCKVETSGGEYPRTIKVDRLTGQTWILSSGNWRELQDK